MIRKKYDQNSALRRLLLMLPRRDGMCETAGAAAVMGSDLVATTADAAQDEKGGDAEDGEHEERHRGAERDVVALDAALECPGGEDLRLIDRPAIGQDADDVEIREGDDQREQHGYRDDVAHHRQRHVPQALPPIGAVDRSRLV